MTWRDDFRPASFRGVRFHIEDSDGRYGRRGVQHEYAGRDLPYFEDLGRAGRSWSMTGYVIGDDYQAARDALLTACEQQGPGRLVHPYLGELQVFCTQVSVAERRAEGGMARFTFTFLEAGSNVFPESRQDTRARVLSQVASARAALRTAAAASFTVARLPQFVAVSAAAVVESFADLLEQMRPVGGLAGARQEPLTRLIGTLKADALSLVRTPDLAAKIAESVQAYAAGLEIPEAGVTPSRADTAEDLARGLRELSRFQVARDGARSAATAARAQEAQNCETLKLLVRSSALLEQAALAGRMSFASYDAAAGFRDRLAEDFEREVLAAGNDGNDEVFRLLSDTRAVMVQDLTARAATLRPLVTYRTDRVKTSLSLAYKLYQDSGRAGELERRNRSWHPAFMPLLGRALAA